MSNYKFWTVFFLVVGLAFGCICGLSIALFSAGYSITQWLPKADGEPGKSSVFGPRIGQPAPDFELTNLNDETIQLSSLRGQPVVLNFWASWCGPCAEEMPIFQKYHQKYPEMQLLAVNAGEPQAKVQEYATDHEYTFDFLLDATEKVNRAYRVSAIPATYFIDAEGVIVAIQLGSMTEKQFQKYLKQIGIPQE
jgi:cytochrome c biogenesis protein CcmG, thiol:disulfide interchange protein DsbE